MSLAPLPTDASVCRTWSWADYAPYYEALLGQPLTADSLPGWLHAWTELSEVLGEVEARLGVDTTLNTADEAAEHALLSFAREVAEPRKAAEQQAKTKLLESGLSLPTIETALKIMAGEARAFREANLARETQIVELSNEFDKLVGAQTVDWDGEALPLSMLGLKIQDPDRGIRERAWRAKHERILADRSRYNELWQQMYAIRKDIAAEAGFATYQDYMWVRLGRLDYTPADVAQFRKTILEVVVPAAQRILARRQARLGLDAIRPWDAEANAYGNEPLNPFQGEDDLLDNTESVFAALDGQLDAWFREMRAKSLMDLFARPNKANGGYCTTFSRSRQPYIFMNAAGTHDDLQTLFHEAGHAFHAYACFERSNELERQPPMEFCEVASMGMEMLCQSFLDRFYSSDQSARAQIQHIERCLLFWPYMAVVDGFQDWAYSSPSGSDPAACDAKWRELWRQYMAGIDYSGLEAIEETGWHRKLHIFQVPFYYVEYGLAQIGAFQVWANSRRDLAGAVRQYREALTLGSSVGLPRLFEAVGGRFAFDTETLGSLVADAEETVNSLLGQMG